MPSRIWARLTPTGPRSDEVNLHPFAKAWEARDLDRLLALLSDDVVFHSPFVGEPGFEGRDPTAVIFTIALTSLEDVRFTHGFGDDRSHVLVATAAVSEKPIKSTTLLEFDDEGKIREIWMMIRPLTGLAALAEAVGRAIESRDPSVYELAKPLVGLAADIDRTAGRLVDDLNRSTA